jgi:hypothetical protein
VSSHLSAWIISSVASSIFGWWRVFYRHLGVGWALPEEYIKSAEVL